MTLLRKLCPPWLDRVFHLLFFNKRCIKITFYGWAYSYNDIITDGNGHYRGLGKDWYVQTKIDKRL